MSEAGPPGKKQDLGNVQAHFYNLFRATSNVVVGMGGKLTAVYFLIDLGNISRTAILALSMSQLGLFSQSWMFCPTIDCANFSLQ